MVLERPSKLLAGWPRFKASCRKLSSLHRIPNAAVCTCPVSSPSFVGSGAACVQGLFAWQGIVIPFVEYSWCSLLPTVKGGGV